MEGNNKTIALIGGGPSSFRVLKRIAERDMEYSKTNISVILIEKQDRLGVGLPYSRKTTDSEHRIAANETITRLEKGDELEQRFHDAIDMAKRNGVSVQVKYESNVIDVQYGEKKKYVIKMDDYSSITADYVVLATGHWKNIPELSNSDKYVSNPWPVQDALRKSKLSESVGIVGTSLTAIDIAISLANSRGEFVTTENGVVYKVHEDTPICITMFSRSGMLPRVAGFGITEGRGELEGSEKYDKYLTEDLAFSPAMGRVSNLLSYAYRRLCMDFLTTDALDSLRNHFDEELLFTGDFRRDMNIIKKAISKRSGVGQFYVDYELAKGSIKSKSYIPWQSLLWQKTDIFWWLFHLYSAEDRLVIDDYSYQTLCFVRPLNFYNASRIKALIDAGILKVKKVSQAYSVSEDSNGFSVFNGVYAGEDIEKEFFAGDTLIDCRGQSTNLENADDILMKNLKRSGLIKSAYKLFEDSNEKYPLGGIHIDPYTLKVRPLFESSLKGNMYTLGPTTLGYYPIADGLHPLPRLALKIVDDIFRDINDESNTQAKKELYEY
ncbi:FAD/NAD(P)-binding protein [Teredinibacter sp. KSP-S5-2]|uniref:FAD/NAD(P)-binding protein n=1 Tax=Teredinibacter sp. KSP-S5-2 TaxID=3034506 RepID=UPI0029347E08|nr:FAD-dependent oxidoreductase [Teredinibacter sp. KSP-S5-2]WNO11593.1 FAD-dependent oxidoreductase [Teredinibacter sp. KSP-S5-2]